MEFTRRTLLQFLGGLAAAKSVPAMAPTPPVVEPIRNAIIHDFGFRGIQNEVLRHFMGELGWDQCPDPAQSSAWHFVLSRDIGSGALGRAAVMVQRYYRDKSMPQLIYTDDGSIPRPVHGDRHSIVLGRDRLALKKVRRNRAKMTDWPRVGVIYLPSWQGAKLRVSADGLPAIEPYPWYFGNFGQHTWVFDHAGASLDGKWPRLKSMVRYAAASITEVSEAEDGGLVFKQLKNRYVDTARITVTSDALEEMR